MIRSYVTYPNITHAYNCILCYYNNIHVFVFSCILEIKKKINVLSVFVNTKFPLNILHFRKYYFKYLWR